MQKGFMRITLDLPDEVFPKLKAEAALRGLKLKELVTELIESELLLGSPQQPAPHHPRSPLPVVRPATGVVHPALTNAEIEEALANEDAKAARP